MRILHNQSSVSGEHDSAARFLQLRDETRRNALIYTDSLLPKADEVVRRIKEYAFEIRVSSFEEWRDGLDDIRKEVTKAEKACNQLMRMHENLIAQLKRNEDNALVSIQDLEKLKAIYEEDRKRLLNTAKEHLTNKERYDRLGANTKANEEQREIDKNLLMATASQRNGEITQEAVNLTEECLIPAIKNFLTNLGACSAFLTATREHLSRLSSREVQDDGKRSYFGLMKMHAEELENNCMAFFTSSTHIRTDLKAIPAEPSDKNYVDAWLSDQLASLDISSSSKKGSVPNNIMLPLSPNRTLTQQCDDWTT